MDKLILGFVGEIASGKGTACDYLIEKHQAGYHRFSTILRDILDRLFIPHTRENLQTLSTSLRQTFTEDLLAKVMSNEVDKDNAQIICVDGIRRPADIAFLKSLPNFHLVYITADEKTRYERIIKRTENTDDQQKTFADFQADQLRETEIKIKELGETAQQTIANDGTVNDLHLKIEELLTSLNYAAKS